MTSKKLREKQKFKKYLPSSKWCYHIGSTDKLNFSMLSNFYRYNIISCI